MPGPTINVGIDPAMLAAVGEYGNAVKAAQAETKRLSQQVQQAARDGKQVSKEMADDLAKSYRELEKFKSLYKASKQGVNMGGGGDVTSNPAARDDFSRMFDDKLRRMASQGDGHGGGLGQLGSIRNLHALQGLLNGNVSPHSIHRLTEMAANTEIGAKLGLGKLAGSIGAAIPAAMIGEQIFRVFADEYQKSTDLQERTAKLLMGNINSAEEMGVSGAARKLIERGVPRLLAKQRAVDNEGKEYDDSRLFGADSSYDQKLQEEAVKDQEEEAKVLRMMPAARKHLQTLGIQPGNVYRAADRLFGKGQRTTEQLNDTMDRMIAEELTRPDGGQNELAKELAKEKHAREAEIQHQIRMEWDPAFAASERNREQMHRATEQFQLSQKQGWSEY